MRGLLMFGEQITWQPWSSSIRRLMFFFLNIHVNFTGTAIHRTDWLMLEVAGINGGSVVAAHATQDAGDSLSAFTAPTVDGGSEALYVAAGGCSLFGAENNTVDSPWSFGSSPTGNFDQMNFTPFGGAYMIGSGQQAATFRTPSPTPASYALVNVAFLPAGANNGGGGGDSDDAAQEAADAAVRAAIKATYDAVRAARDGNELVTFKMVRGVPGHTATLRWTDAEQVILRGDAELN